VITYLLGIAIESKRTEIAEAVNSTLEWVFSTHQDHVSKIEQTLTEFSNSLQEQSNEKSKEERVRTSTIIVLFCENLPSFSFSIGIVETLEVHDYYTTAYCHEFEFDILQPPQYHVCSFS
jgi:hypothetical protein